MTDLSAAETTLRAARETLAGFVTKRASHEKKLAAMSKERAELSYDAHRGDGKSRKRLGARDLEVQRIDSEFLSIDAAIQTARSRVAAAESAHQAAEEAEKAREALALLAEFRNLGTQLDAAASALVASYAAFKDCYRSLRELGVKHPEPELVRIACRNAVIAALMPSDIALHRDPPPAFIPPGQRHSFQELVTAWATGVEKWCEQRLPAPASTETESEEAS